MIIACGLSGAPHYCRLVLAMTSSGYLERIYPTTKLAPFMDLLKARGIPPAEVLPVVGLSEADVESPHTLVSVDQVLTFYGEILNRAPDPGFPYQAGLRFHPTTYGMYGLAMLSSSTFRQALNIDVKYHQLSTPTVSSYFDPGGRLARWVFTPIAHPKVRGKLYEFLVWLHIGIFVSLHRDVMGRDFHFVSFGLTFDPTPDAVRGFEPYAAATIERKAENEVCFDSAGLDHATQMGSPAVNRMLIEICKAELVQLKKREGLSGRVREEIIKSGCRKIGLNSVARQLNLTERSLRRRLEDESTSYREIHDELQLQTAVKYLRDTAMTIEDIAESLGYSDAANFRRAFRRWTNRTPQEYRNGSD
jgi:AraC-like DNA-binding protein